MSELINSHVKSEFKRFFEYAFQGRGELWQGAAPELAEIFSKKVRSPEDERKYNIALSKIIHNKNALIGVLAYNQLFMDEKLRYYIYLFIRDLGVTDEELIGYGIPIPSLKTSEQIYDAMFNKDVDGALPAKLIPVFDDPQVLLSILRDQKEDYHTRDTALNRLRQLCPLTKFPDFVFVKETFASGKQSEWNQKSQQLSPYKEAYAKSADLSKKDIVNAIFKSIEKDDWEAFRFHIEGAMRTSGQKVYFTMKSEKDRHLGRSVHGDDPNFIEKLLCALFGGCTTYIIDKFAVPSKTLLDKMGVAKKIIDEEWDKYQQENKAFLKEFEEYNKGLENIDFYSASLSLIKDFTKDEKYILLKNKFGAEVMNQIWHDSIKLIDQLRKNKDFEVKRALLNRLEEISIFTLSEWKKIRECLMEIELKGNVIFGDHFENFNFPAVIKALSNYYGVELIKGIEDFDQPLEQPKKKDDL